MRLAAQGTENTMPFLLDAVRAGACPDPEPVRFAQGKLCEGERATLGEIMSMLKEVFGVYEESVEI